MIIINSQNNSLVKQIKSLKLKKFRDETNTFFIEGLRFIEEAFKDNVNLSKIIVSESFQSSKHWDILLEKNTFNIEIHLFSDKLFKLVSDTSTPQGIMAILSKKDYTLENMCINNRSTFIALDSIQDPGNMGTIIRTADASGIDGILISKGCTDIYNPKVLRSTMGSIFRMPIYECENLPNTLKSLKEKSFKIYAAHLDGENNHFNVTYAKNTCIIIGNEALGISSEVLSHSDHLVKIPIIGKAESLNASVAASILMYERLRQNYSIVNP